MNQLKHLGIICFILVFGFKTAYTQEAASKESQTLFGNVDIDFSDVGYFIAPGYAYTQMDGADVSLFQVRGGAILGNALSVGANFDIAMNQFYPMSETVQGIYMDYWSVGGFLEYTLLSDKLVHLTFPLSFGYGEVEMDNYQGEAGLGEQNFLQVEPAALLEINLTKYMKFNAGAGYRFVTPMNYRNLNQTDLTGLNARAGLKFGLFK